MPNRTKPYRHEAALIGVDDAVMRAGMWWLEFKATQQTRRPDGRFIIRTEQRLMRDTRRVWKEQMEYVLETIKTFNAFKETKGVRRIERKGLEDDLFKMLAGMPGASRLVRAIRSNAEKAMLRAGKQTSSKIGININFDLQNREAVNYLSRLEDIHLSDRDGSIHRTTRNGIVDIVKQGADEGLTYTEMTKRIKGLQQGGIFSRARAQMIATDQIGKAYETGNRIVAKEAEAQVGEQMMKKWETVGDEKVTEGCRENSAKGWIPIDENFPSGNLTPTRFPRCRCSCRYEFMSTLQASGELKAPEVKPQEADPTPEAPFVTQVDVQDGLGNHYTVHVPDGYAYHRTPPSNIQSIAEQGLLPRVSDLDRDAGDNGRVYFGGNEALTGVGLDMRTDSSVLLRVRAGAIQTPKDDPHIPDALTFYTNKPVSPDLLEIRDPDTGTWMSIEEFIRRNP